MIATSRPLRFLVLVLGGWTGLRAVQLWPGDDPAADLAAAIVPPANAGVLAAPPNAAPIVPAAGIARAAKGTAAAPPRNALSQPDLMFTRDSDSPPAPTRDIAGGNVASIVQRTASIPGSSIVPAVRPASAQAPRLAGSGWMIVRGGGAATPLAPQLGGSQGGVRLTYALDDARRLSIAARFASALGSRQREAALGLDWRPTALPLHLVAEQRIAIAGARGGPAVGLIGGIGPRPIAGRMTIEAYAQGGAIARGGVEGFADGSLRLAHPVAAHGGVRFDLGLGAWGGAQRGAARLDIGPSASVVLPTLGTPLRVSLEWRQRVAGRARPGSGPALSIGSDF